MASSKFIAILVIMLVGYAVQQTVVPSNLIPTSISLNTCSNLGSASPKKSTDCTSSNTSSTSCCYVSATTAGQSYSMCVAVPAGTSTAGASSMAAAYGAAATVTCSSSFVSFSLMILFIAALLF